VLLTEQCNMRCRYCTTAKRDGDMGPEVMGHVVRLLESTEPAGLDVNFHGGEPTLHWDGIVALAEALQPTMGRRRVSFNMCTNGTHLDADRAAWLAEQDVDVRVSIDGRVGAHASNRLPRFERAAADALHKASVAGLEHLVDAGVSTSVNMVVTPETVDQLLDNAVFLLRKGLVHLIVSPVVGQHWDGPSLLALDAQLRQVMVLWQRWFSRADERAQEQLRRSLLSEVERATYCAGLATNQPDATFVVFTPDGRVLGDEPDYRVEGRLLLAQVDQVDRLEALPALPRTAFQLMYDEGFYTDDVLQSVRRTHTLLRKRTEALYLRLFGEAASEAQRL
jgi:sulfatase maturation enzyme AslB (radical SAM superfamily)